MHIYIVRVTYVCQVVLLSLISLFYFPLFSLYYFNHMVVVYNKLKLKLMGTNALEPDKRGRFCDGGEVEIATSIIQNQSSAGNCY